MTSRIHTQNQQTKKDTQDLSTTSTQGMFQPRPFVVQTQRANQVQQPDLETSIVQAKHYGHHLNEIDISASKTEALQPKMEIGKPVQLAPKKRNKLATNQPPANQPNTNLNKPLPPIPATDPNKKPRPKSWHEMDRTNQNPQFQESLGIMREALNIDPAHRNDPKIGFPFNHFDHAFGTTSKEESVTVKGGEEHKRTIQTPKDTTDVNKITPMLPASLTQGGHLEHQLRQGDAAKASSSSGSQNEVTMDRVREAAVGTKFAHDTALSLDKLHQPSAEIDFQSETPSGKKVQFDPFTSPQSKKPTTKQLLGQQLLEEKTLTEKQLPSTHKQTPVKLQQQQGIDKKWVNDAFTKHTNQSKGEGVIGLWDQTSDSQQRVNELKQNVNQQPKDFKPRLQNVDLKLDEEYVREDMQVQRDLAKKRRRKSI